MDILMQTGKAHVQLSPSVLEDKDPAVLRRFCSQLQRETVDLTADIVLKMLDLSCEVPYLKVDYNELVTVNDDYIRRLKHDTAAALKESDKSPGGIDDAIIPLLSKINAVEGLATRWSCAGHPEKSDDQAYFVFYRTDFGDFWINHWKSAIIDEVYRNVPLRGIEVIDEVDVFASPLHANGEVCSRRTLRFGQLTTENHQLLHEVLLKAAKCASDLAFADEDCTPASCHPPTENVEAVCRFIDSLPIDYVELPLTDCLCRTAFNGYDTNAESLFGAIALINPDKYASLGEKIYLFNKQQVAQLNEALALQFALEDVSSDNLERCILEFAEKQTA